jgi:hypothetical protein
MGRRKEGGGSEGGRCGIGRRGDRKGGQSVREVWGGMG